MEAEDAHRIEGTPYTFPWTPRQPVTALPHMQSPQTVPPKNLSVLGMLSWKWVSFLKSLRAIASQELGSQTPLLLCTANMSMRKTQKGRALMGGAR